MILFPMKMIRRIRSASAPSAVLGFSAAFGFSMISAGLLWTSCDWGGSTGPAAPAVSAGMKKISAAGKTFRQGSTGPLSHPDEAPVMENGFTYDFEMDSTEVTQGVFADFMKRKPVPDSSRYGSGPDLPVYDVSWFDAVLFCNARSKRAGYDTVYEYSAVDQAAGGGAYGLEGLSVHLDRAGFRLPTEAEWEFAARAGSAADFPWGAPADSSQASAWAWFQGNAQGTVHPVAKLKPNAFGLYDMAGNVMEWVGDWKGPYPKQGGNDFAGARDPEPAYDTPVKGGAFRYGLAELRPANRGATYTTLRSSTAEYVGFRCSLGAIKTPAFSSPDGAWTGTDPVALQATRLGALVEGRAAKLVFVNAAQSVRHLVYVDYTANPPRVREFSDIADVFYPTLSPDGKWVAFGSREEGAVSGSMVRIRRLDDSASSVTTLGPGFIPRWWVDPASRDTFLIYSSTGADNSQAQWNAGQTLRQKISGGAAAGAPAQLTSDGAFHDGLSLDGRWLATGFRLLKLRDLQNGGTRILFTAPANGKSAGDTSQVCNVSIAPDSSGRTMFLDFGYAAKSALTGSDYALHQIAFIADPAGAAQRWYKAPAMEASWEDLEWSNQPRYAVSASNSPAGVQHDLWLLDLADSAYTRLVSGTELETPGLWLGDAPDSIPADGIDADSLGHYNDPVGGGEEEVFSNRMHKFWAHHDDWQVIFTGSSHAYSGIDPHRITGLSAFNIGYPSNGWLGQMTWVANYALNHSANLKVLVMEAFPGWLNYPGGDFNWLQEIARTKGVQYDQSHGYWKGGLPFRFEDRIARAPYSTLYPADSAGFISTDSGGWGGAAALTGGVTDWDLNNAEYQANMQSIEAFAKLLADLKIHVVFVNFPTNPAFKGNAWYGPYGPRLEVATVVINRFKAMESISPYVHFYDANNFNNHDYTDAEALNWGHLDSAGAAKLTGRLDSLIHTFQLR